MICSRMTCQVLLLILIGSYSLSAQGLPTTEWKVTKLPPTVNTPFDEIAPVPTRDGRTLFYTRVGYPEFDRTLIFDTIDYSQKLSEDKYLRMLSEIYLDLGSTTFGNPERSIFNQDIWWARLDSAHVVQEVVHPGYPLNNALPNSLVAITPNPREFLVINQFKPEGDMKRGFSKVRVAADGSVWEFPQPIEIKDYYTLTSEVNLTMSFDGRILILSAMRFDSRGADLYICMRDPDTGQWGSPRNLGPTLNSDRREITPFLSEDNRTLFFASNRIGQQLDLYFSRREDDTWMKWSPPVQLVSPINSPYDEGQPYFNMTSGNLYFTSKRDGSSDIYSVQIAPPQPTEIEVRGQIIRKDNNQFATDATLDYGISGDGFDATSIPVKDGTFTIRVPKGIPFELCPSKTGFFGRCDSLFFRQEYYYFQDYYTITLYVYPFTEGDKIEIPPLFFQQSKAIILETSFADLERLAGLLRDNPKIHIRVEGHTDNVGQPVDLLLLSQQRADAVRDFLVQKGIAADRISTIGHGAKYPLDTNTSEYARQRNRRVEFIIIKT
jgi:OmpA family/WD40-like Beta Propeller Repeat